MRNSSLILSKKEFHPSWLAIHTGSGWNKFVKDRENQDPWIKEDDMQMKDHFLSSGYIQTLNSSKKKYIFSQFNPRKVIIVHSSCVVFTGFRTNYRGLLPLNLDMKKTSNKLATLKDSSGLDIYWGRKGHCLWSHLWWWDRNRLVFFINL